MVFMEEEINFFLEIWLAYRPYGVKLVVNFLVSGSIWLIVYAFELVERILPIPRWSASVIGNMHATGAVIALFVFSIFSIIDIIRVYRGK